ncbi:uncharacterized protein LOC144104379 isoform X2 [Amblyomma americanum]
MKYAALSPLFLLMFPIAVEAGNTHPRPRNHLRCLRVVAELARSSEKSPAVFQSLQSTCDPTSLPSWMPVLSRDYEAQHGNVPGCRPPSTSCLQQSAYIRQD